MTTYYDSDFHDDDDDNDDSNTADNIEDLDDVIAKTMMMIMII